MAVTSIGSYLTTLDEFISHWADVNAELGGTPATDLTLHGGYSREAMIADRAALQTAVTDLVDKENDRQIAASGRDIAKEELRERLASFRGMLRGKLPESPYLAAAPRLPHPAAAVTKFLTPLDDMASLWAKVDADTTTAGFTPPLLLAAGYDLATFVTDLADLRTMFAAVASAVNELRVARKQRDALLPPARARMLQYRTLVTATFGDTHPLTLSQPSFHPPGGSPPAAVTLSGHWDARSDTAQLSWTPSSDANFEEYSLRMTPGPVYDAGTAAVVETLSAGVEAADTNAGLSNPGDAASFKVFVVRHSGGERGSNTVTITRP
jgi:hypothetical protein